MPEQICTSQLDSKDEGLAMLLFCGDTFQRTRNGADPFKLILGSFEKRNVCLNLETSLKGGKQKEKNVSLSVDEKALDYIPETVRFVSIVNNHIADGAPPANLFKALEQRGKAVIGPDNPAVTSCEIEGMKVDFFSAYFPLPRMRTSYVGSIADTLEEMIRTSKAERKILNLHWGYEHTDVPAPFQREMARRLADAGASIIIGHHPHVPQGWEIYRETPIFYSLGNFNFWQFDTETKEKNRWGYMVQYDLHTNSVEPIPYRINENYQPFSVDSEDRSDLLTQLEVLSEMARCVNFKTWFATHYRQWYKHEFAVWKRLCLKRRSPRFFLKWIAWLLLPIQLKYYSYAGRFRMSSIRSGK